MTCDDAVKLLPLFLYGEMDFEAEEDLHAHLESCASCRDALARDRMLHSALDERDLEVSPFLLRRNRQQLAQSLAAGPARHSGLFGLSSVFSGWDWMPRFARPAGAVALVALGYFAAQVTPVGVRRIAESGLVDPSAAHVRYVEPADNGKVQIVVDETHSRVISGRLDDEPIRKLLISAAKDPNDPGLRGESLDILKHQCESDEIRSALLNSLLHDSNPGVRLKALEALKPYSGHPDVRKALPEVLLHDNNSGVRTQAIDLLTQGNNEDKMVGVLQELMRKEPNTYVRGRCERALRDMKASVETY
jgi:hypothetical protein